MLKIIGWVLVVYLLISGFMYFMQQHMLYFPDTHKPIPQAWGVPEMKPITLATKDGLTLTSWYKPSTDPHLPTFVYFHGNAGHIGSRGFLVKPLLSAGYGVLLVGYRGYGGNPGNPSEQGFYQDGSAAIKFLRKKNVPDKCIVIYGASIGSGVAVEIANRYPIGALILQAPFTSMTDVASFHYPYLPLRWLIRDRYTSIDKIDAIDAPLLIMHGKRDTVVPFKFGQALYAKAQQPKEFRQFTQANHNNIVNFNVMKDTIKFVQRYVDC